MPPPMRWRQTTFRLNVLAARAALTHGGCGAREDPDAQRQSDRPAARPPGPRVDPGAVRPTAPWAGPAGPAPPHGWPRPGREAGSAARRARGRGSPRFSLEAEARREAARREAERREAPSSARGPSSGARYVSRPRTSARLGQPAPPRPAPPRPAPPRPAPPRPARRPPEGGPCQ
jgi:hypothetical protein